MSGDSGGYRGAGLDLLSRHGVSAGDAVSIVTEEGEMSGVLMPRYESASEDYIVIKLKSGYNTGIKVAKVKSILKIAGAKNETLQGRRRRRKTLPCQGLRSLARAAPSQAR